MIFATDFNSIGVQHEQFNISFLEILRLVYPDEPITFSGDESHINVIERGVPSGSRISFSKAAVYQQRGGFKEFIKAFKEYRLLKEMLRTAEAGHSAIIFIFLINPFTHFLLKQFNAINTPVYIVCHGELETLKFNKTKLNKIWGMFLLKALKKIRSNVRYIILGESIYQNLIPIFPSIEKMRPVVIDHPYPFRNNDLPLKSKEEPSWTFALVGVVTIHKYSQYFYKIAREMKEGGGHENVQFLACGKVYADMAAYLNEFVISKEIGASYKRSELDERVRSSDFVVFYYDNTNYSLCSSGAFWDAVNAGKPILFVSNDYFRYYSDIVGEIGIEFNNAEELNNYIKDICDKGFDREKYNFFVRNISTLKSQYITNERIAHSFKEQV